MTVRGFHEEHGYWPTTREAHAFLALEKNHELAKVKGPEYIRRRLSELVVDLEDNHPDLLEKMEPRGQQYLVEQVDDISSTAEAHPLKISDWNADGETPTSASPDPAQDTPETTSDTSTASQDGESTESSEPGDEPEYIFDPEEESGGEPGEDTEDEEEESVIPDEHEEDDLEGDGDEGERRQARLGEDGDLLMKDGKIVS